MICDIINKSMTPINSRLKTLKDRKGGQSKYIVENSSNSDFFEINFEKDVYQDRHNDTKCDFGIKTATTIHYIELKGSDVKGGISQLLSTVQETSECFMKEENGKKVFLEKKARLIVSKFQKPDFVKQSKDYKDLVKAIKFIDRKNDHLIIKQNIYTETI